MKCNNKLIINFFNTQFFYFNYTFIIILILFEINETIQQGVNIRLRQGDIQGILIETHSRQVYAYLGIPYAKPPVDIRRFKPPQRHDGWQGIYKAVEFGPACPQPFHPGVISEDCLFLNIWVPANERFRQIPVVVVLEGELFLTSDPSRFPGQDLSVYGLIVVTINYRVNAFGFLSWSDQVLPGNLGLLDQRLALEWVSENIEMFGGDKRSITLLGHSAGAASVAYHLAAKQRNVLFTKAIMLSGSSLSPWAISMRPRTATSALARELGCQIGSAIHNMSFDLLRCLQRRDITISEIVIKLEKMIEAGNPYYLFGPVYDGHVDKERQIVGADGPLRSLENVPSNIPLLVGISQHDGSIILHIKREINYMSYAYLRKYGKEILIPMVNAMSGNDGPSMPLLNHLVDFNYLQRAGGGDKIDLVKKIVQMFTDSFFAAPVVAMVEILARRGVDIHFFINDFVSADIYKSPSNITGSMHGSELVFLFGPVAYTRIFHRPMTYAEAKMSETLKKMVYSFAIRGVPSLGVSYPPPPRWTKYTLRYPVYALLNSGQISNKYRYYDLAFWNFLLKDISTMVSIPSTTTYSTTTLFPTTTTRNPFTTDSTTSSSVTIAEVSNYRSAVWILLGIVLLIVCTVGSYMIFSRRRQRLKSATLHVP